VTVADGDILQIELGPLDRLDAIRRRGDQVYVLAIVKRGRVKTRTWIEIYYPDALRLARFLADVRPMPRPLSDDDDDEEDTKPGPP
jgi:hypothetical protein